VRARYKFIVFISKVKRHKYKVTNKTSVVIWSKRDFS